MVIDNAGFYACFLSHLTHCPRELYHFNKILDTQKEKTLRDADAQKLAELLKRLFTLLHSAYLKHDPSCIEEMHRIEKEELFSLIYANQGKTTTSRAAGFHLAAAARNLCLASSPLLGVMLGDRNKED